MSAESSDPKLAIKWPMLVNWDGDLIPTGPELFHVAKIRHESGRTISYPQSVRGDRPILWILSLDALFFEFNHTHFTNLWAMPLRQIIRLVRDYGYFLPERKITAAELGDLIKTARPDNPDFNTRQMLEEIIASKRAEDFLTEEDMIQFQCLDSTSTRGIWPE